VLRPEQNLGVRAKVYSVSSSGVESWFWEAPKGLTLKWKDT
jgi:hypothetical protein